VIFLGGFGLPGEFEGPWCTKLTPKPESTPIYEKSDVS
jgi:hypothetical protein